MPPAAGTVDAATPAPHARTFRVRPCRNECARASLLGHSQCRLNQVMRLCRPSVVAERPLLLAPDDLGHPVRGAARLAATRCADAAVARASLLQAEPPRAWGDAAPDASAGFAHRFELGGACRPASHRVPAVAACARCLPKRETPLTLLRAAAPSDAAGLRGALLLPQSFGSIHLGESFASYVSVANFSSRRVTLVGVKAELQTDKTRAVLHDTTAAPAASLAPGERLDVLVEADVKAAGAHTLVCSAAYVDADGERRFLPQYFKFNAANPLAVRTKARTRQPLVMHSCTAPRLLMHSPPPPCAQVRALPGGATLLEACVENLTKVRPLIA